PQQFTAKYQLPFPLLSDADGQLRKKYALPRPALGLLPGRITYVLGGEGRGRYVFSSRNEATSHVLNAQEHPARPALAGGAAGARPGHPAQTART
ncbi:MAG: redoxin domain-containing protein, partial [Hymenobacter sp.]